MLFKDIKDSVATHFEPRKVKTTSLSFKLTTSVTVAFLIGGALLIAAKEFFG